MNNPSAALRIIYGCSLAGSREQEQFIDEHIFSYQLAGSMLIDNGLMKAVVQPGDFYFTKRNQLIRCTKLPFATGDFKAICIPFTQQLVRAYGAAHQYAAREPSQEFVVTKLPVSALYQNLVDSLFSYANTDQLADEELLSLKMKEALHIVLKVNPELAAILFDFSAPGKIDLAAFMHTHFRFNVGLDKLAYLTGRSLAAFKRDFRHIFGQSPGRWLTQRRLQEAHYQIRELGKKPVEIYLGLGFENFSHFSYAFRRAYGLTPSALRG